MEPCRGHIPLGASWVAGRTLSGRVSPAPAFPPCVEWSLILSQSEGGLRPPSRGVWSGGHALAFSFHVTGNVRRGASPAPEQASPHPEEHHERPCVFILRSINGIFSNGDWEMDLVFKKDVDFDDKTQGKYIP